MTWIVMAAKAVAGALIPLLKRIPMWGYALLGAAIACWVLVKWDGRRHAASFERGRQSVLQQATPDSAEARAAAAAIDTARAGTDSIIERIRWRVAKVDTAAILAAALASRVSAESRRDPVVDSLVRLLPQLQIALTGARADVSMLRDSLTKERINTDLALKVERANTVAARIIVIAQQEQIEQLEKRPRRSTLITVGAAALTTGVVFGKWVWPMVFK